jgi:hypothetical protein
MPKPSRFIDGIFNYCDRWCERCHMTQHCRVYETERAIDEAAPGETETVEFWQQLDERLDLELHSEAAESWADEFLDVEPPTEEEMEEYAREHEWQEKLVESTDLNQAAEAYRREVFAWLRTHEAMWERTASGRRPRQGQSLELGDAMDVVSWYHTLTAAKVHRALLGKQDGDDWAEDRLQSDWNGSAKVALLGIERSIGAWSLIRDRLPDEVAAVRRFIARCGLLRRLLLEEFPDAREFVRPGFDDR